MPKSQPSCTEADRKAAPGRQKGGRFRTYEALRNSRVTDRVCPDIGACAHSGETHTMVLMAQRLIPHPDLEAPPISYSCLDFPLQPWQLIVSNGHGQRTAKKGEDYVRWIKSIELERTRYAAEFFDAVGIGTPRSETVTQSIQGFQDALRLWIPRIFEPSFGTYWFYSLPNGQPSFAAPGSADHDVEWEAFDVSLALDIALQIVSAARETRSLEWVVSLETFGTVLRSGRAPLSYLPTLAPGSGRIYPISIARAVVTGSLVNRDTEWAKARQRADQGTYALADLYRALVDGSNLA
jgi:hypothetical protein